MSETSHDERRGAPRIAWDGRVKLAGIKTVHGRIVNVSEGGLLVEVQRTPFSVGSEVMATFTLPGRDAPISARAEVVRQQAGSQIALRFLRLSGDELAAIADWAKSAG